MITNKWKDYSKNKVNLIFKKIDKSILFANIEEAKKYIKIKYIKNKISPLEFRIDFVDE